MIRPAERFAVNIVRHEPESAPLRRSGLLSLPMVVAVAAIAGIGLGGIMPAAWGPPSPVTAAHHADPATIEPAAGPGTVLEVPRAPDRGFYAPVLFDRIPVTMRLAPELPQSLLTPRDAGRLSVGGATGGAVQVSVMELGPVRLGPVLLELGPADAPTSVLGADLLSRLAVVTVDGERLRLAPR